MPKQLKERLESRESLSATEIEDEESVAVEEYPPANKEEVAERDHSRIQGLLLHLGRSLGYDIWVAPNDRRETLDGVPFGNLPGVLQKLPVQWGGNMRATKTIGLIDVLWLKNNIVRAAFEIESTTLIYSGLLRMADLVSLMPTLQVDLYVVAPAVRARRVEEEITRPAFAVPGIELYKRCSLIRFETLSERLEKHSEILSSVTDKFLTDIAEKFEPPESVEEFWEPD